jgi:hypothetical protein
MIRIFFTFSSLVSDQLLSLQISPQQSQNIVFHPTRSVAMSSPLDSCSLPFVPFISQSSLMQLFEVNSLERLVSFFFFFYYAYVHTRLGSFLLPAPTPSLTTHSAPSLSPPPPQYPADTILPLFLILL